MDQHPIYWCNKNHYGQCGQSCPCCRAEVGDTFGACPICIIKFNKTIQMVKEFDTKSDNKCDNQCDNRCCKRKRKFTKNNGNNSKKQRR